jgi:hypothetical protein
MLVCSYMFYSTVVLVKRKENAKKNINTFKNEQFMFFDQVPF